MVRKKVILALLASKSNPRTDMAYSKTATHELGHALGYAGHSTTKGDVKFIVISDIITEKRKPIS